MRTRSGEARHFVLHRGHAAVGIAATLAVALALAAGGYFAGRGHSSALLQTRVAGLKQNLAHQSASLGDLRTKSEGSIDAVAARMAALDARLNRLDAMGKQIVGLAGLKKSGFNFSKTPGEGGPEPKSETHWKLPDLGAATSVLQQRIWHEQSELAALEEMLLHRNHNYQTVPSGQPIAHGWISSPYGWRTDPFTGERAFHPGIDFAGDRGAPVHAIAAGVVTWA
ncbi:MAG: M23 family metallopeptidase, partial [Gammaproteobacteria bacterium]